MNLRLLIKVLEVSAAKNGKDTPLTIGHLLNICKIVEKEKEKLEFLEYKQHLSLLNRIDSIGQEGLR